MEIAIIFIATILFLIYAYLIMTAGPAITEAIVTCRKETAAENIKMTTISLNKLVARMQKRNELKDKAMIKKGKKLKAKLDENKKALERYEKGKPGLGDLIPVAGYRFIQLMRWDASNDFVKKLNGQCVQFKEKKEAINYSYFVLANLIGSIVLGAVVGIALLGVFLSLNFGIKSAIFAVGAFALFAIIGYLPLDNLNSIINERKEEIENQFPQVASELTLLTVSGMEVSQAWKLVAENGDGVLYDEMSRVLLDLNNNIAPAEAYSKFMVKCNNNYANKLATAIIQNTAKGNSEIVSLFRRLNDECWMERKHSAKRMGEKIQSKLLVPTLLMFGGILLLVIVPVVSGFSFF
ncbi:MAG: type II secretion system F family protein [Lachnospiraceae bacterium]|nr:type II secretion system F family protein [Lachnospiraceae bacterium]